MSTSLLIGSVSAGGLYKSISPNGTVAFTDVPPSDAMVVVQGSTEATLGARQYNTMPNDEAVAQASMRVDFAEHNLAVARKIPGERVRLDFYKRDVHDAHRDLADLLRQRATQPIPASQVTTASAHTNGQS